MSEFSHPYIPNSEKNIKQQMLDAIGRSSIEEIYSAIPEKLRYRNELDIPAPFLSEYELEKHINEVLAPNKSCNEAISFLGGGTWQHYVPSVVDTIASRDEFLTAYNGDTYTELGKYQAMFEANSMLADLLGTDFVSTPSYDWGTAAGVCLRMAVRKQGKSKVLVARSISPGRKSIIANYVKPFIQIEYVNYDEKTGSLDLDDLNSKLDDETAALYFENPNYFGCIEEDVERVREIVGKFACELVVGVDPSSLGVLEAPANYGATIVCGDLQPLGVHMQYGGGLAGFVSSSDAPEYVNEYPQQLYGITTTVKEGEYAWGDVAFERTSYAAREDGKDFVGTNVALYSIISGVYLALMGPHGMRELGEGIMQRVAYAKEVLSQNSKLSIKHNAFNFKEFIVDFSASKKSVHEINKALLEHNIFGGISLEEDFPQLKNCALYCVTEVLNKKEIDTLASVLQEVL